MSNVFDFYGVLSALEKRFNTLYTKIEHHQDMCKFRLSSNLIGSRIPGFNFMYKNSNSGDRTAGEFYLVFRLKGQGQK